MARKVIITCAVTGAIHTPSMSRYLPVTPGQIAEAAIGAAELAPQLFTYMLVTQLMAAPLRIRNCLSSFCRLLKRLAMW